MRPMYADLKNDFVFRKVFGAHPVALIGLLNDLLDLRGDAAIAAIDPPVRAGTANPWVQALDPRREVPRRPRASLRRRGIQVVHVEGFLNRVVYNAAKAFIAPLEPGGRYADLVPVVAVSICDFALWPDAERDAAGLPRASVIFPLALHRAGHRSAGHQAGAARLPRAREAHRPDPRDDVERWAMLFAHARPHHESIRGVPLTEAQRLALEVTSIATFTDTESDAYQRVHDEVQQALQLAEDHLERGLRIGHDRGTGRGSTRASTPACGRSSACSSGDWAAPSLTTSGSCSARASEASGPSGSATSCSTSTRRHWPRGSARPRRRSKPPCQPARRAARERLGANHAAPGSVRYPPAR